MQAGCRRPSRAAVPVMAQYDGNERPQMQAGCRRWSLTTLSVMAGLDRLDPAIVGIGAVAERRHPS
jgi:hypothetical protein